jgi:hypothetical protein
MIISIPLTSTLLLVAAALMALGVLVYPLSARLSVIGIGAGSILMGVEAIRTHPHGFELPGLFLFGIAVLVGLWMVMVGLKKPAGKGPRS